MRCIKGGNNMRIMIFSLGPIFNGQVHGGSQKALRDISIGLGEKGHIIDIYCPRRFDNSEEFKFSENVTVKPVLLFRGTFPEPYEVGPYNIYKSCEILASNMKNYDLFYIHDAELNVEFLKDIIPTVISLRDFCYGETLLGAINFNQSSIIVNSDHSYQCLLDSFNRINRSITRDKVNLIYNGYNYEHFRKKTISEEFYKKLNLEKNTEHNIIGFPHRPDLVKGFIESIEVVSKIIESGKNVKLLIPEYVDNSDFSSRSYKTYTRVMKMIKEKKLENNIVFHKWVPHEMMPEYFSYCDVVLCIGNFCESFSNVSVEALLCETPVLATNSATYRTIPIRKYLNIADYGDSSQIAEKVVEILENKDIDKAKEARNYIIDNLNIKKCVDNYERIFVEAIANFKDNKKTLNLSEINIYDDNSKYHLAPWCYYLKNEIYSDYLYGTYKTNLNQIFKEEKSYTINEMIAKKIKKKDIEDAINDGIILRDFSEEK